MTLDVVITIGVGFIVSVATIAVLYKGNRYWKDRDPYDGELDEQPGHAPEGAPKSAV
ncbi:MAG: hypothetical protein GX750_08240 [Clostridia bacterium]|nr:hypothetical protein [Clostridia bacterium]